MLRLILGLLVLSACAAAPPRAASIEALDAACLRGEPTCEEAAERYATSAAPEAKLRRSEMLYQACRRRPAGCDELARWIAEGVVPPPPSAAVELSEEICDGGPRDEAACVAAALHGRRCDADHAPACAAMAALGDRIDPPQQGELFLRACAGGHGPACVQAAERSVEGDTKPRGLARACESGSAVACFTLGEGHAHGWGVRLDQVLARRFRARACELDHARACYALAAMTAKGIGGGVDARHAVALFAKGCDLGEPAACEAHGRILERGAAGKPPDPAAAYDRYRLAGKGHEDRCEAGDLGACARWAVLLDEGSGMRSDREAARALLERACAGGEAEACVRLASGPRFDTALLEPRRKELARACRAGAGEACLVLARLGEEAMLDHGCVAGHGPSCTAAAMAIPLSEPRARRQAERACALADAGGCHLLGTILELVEPDLEAALVRHREGCLWGSAPACTRTGILLLRGDVRLEPLAAASTLDRGCELADPEACYELGVLELSGERVALDVPHGRGALERACRAGYAAGCGALGAEMLRGRRLPLDLAQGASLLRRGCEGGDDAACLELAEALGGQLPKDEAETRKILARVAVHGERRCEQGLLMCHGAAGAFETTWVVEEGRLRRRLAEAPRCGAELERSCNASREALRRLCLADGSFCWQAAVLVRRMAEGGLAASLAAAAEHEAAAVRWARPACARDEAAACAVMHQAHDLGRGVPADPAESDRFRARACELDRAFCP